MKGARPSSSWHEAGLSPREALLFEAGVKLGGVFHQYIGIPVTPRTAPRLARTIEEAVRLQPFVEWVRVSVTPARGPRVGTGRQRYRYLSAEMLAVEVKLRDGSDRVTARLDYRDDMHYALMHVTEAPQGPDRGASQGRAGKRTSN